MKLKYATVLLMLLSTSVISLASNKMLSDYKEIRIAKHLSEAMVKKSMKQAKTHGLRIIVDPKFNCKSIGYSTKDVVASGTMYGTNRKDGGLNIGGTGDFKAYTYARYMKNGKVCREKDYTKAYDPEHYGQHSIAALFP
ncbi:hypothetical protein [Sulfurovum sp.]|uniref:hypothetical protein n=1 Tax=Sulfurovum sp. TaxID=1969726 RepID=UPI0025E3F8CD|nr:hypothetical protein [Sulfurovum sp.]